LFSLVRAFESDFECIQQSLEKGCSENAGKVIAAAVDKVRVANKLCPAHVDSGAACWSTQLQLVLLPLLALAIASFER
jgi:hypothetical protein